MVNFNGETFLKANQEKFGFLLLVALLLRNEFRMVHQFLFFEKKILCDGSRGFGEVRSNPLKKKRKMRLYSTLTWPQNTGNPISEVLSFKDFPAEDAPGRATGDNHPRSLCQAPFTKTLYPPWPLAGGGRCFYFCNLLLS